MGESPIALECRDFEGDFDVEADKYSGFMSIKKNN